MSMQAAQDTISRGSASEAQLRDIITQTMARIEGRDMTMPTVREWFQQWLDANQARLQPPVGNQQIWKNADLICTVVGGPNERTDFHDDPYEEYFHQFKGNASLLIADRGIRSSGQVYNNRNLEKLFGKFESVKFFLTKENLREVIVKR